MEGEDVLESFSISELSFELLSAIGEANSSEEKIKLIQEHIANINKVDSETVIEFPLCK